MSFTLNEIAAVVGAIATVIGGYWALVTIVVYQFKAHLKERFAAQDKAREEGRTELRGRLDQLEDNARMMERDHLKLLAELPMSYIRREDHIRFETVINAKLDALNTRLDMIGEKMTRN